MVVSEADAAGIRSGGMCSGLSAQERTGTDLNCSTDNGQRSVNLRVVALTALRRRVGSVLGGSVFWGHDFLTSHKQGKYRQIDCLHRGTWPCSENITERVFEHLSTFRISQVVCSCTLFSWVHYFSREIGSDVEVY